MNKESVINSLKERFKESGKDEQTMDWDAEYDSELLPNENFNILKAKVDILLGKQEKELVNEIKSNKYEIQQKESFNNWINSNLLETKKLKDLFNTPKIIGLIGDVNTGKSNALYYFIKLLKEDYNFNLFSYGLRYDLGENKIFSVEELEKIKDSLIVIDEFSSIFDIEDRKKRKLIERTIRLIHHNNNVLILTGLPSNFVKFIASKVSVFIYSKSNINDFINGSKTKEICVSYMGSELGSSILNLPKNQLLVFNGENYSKLNIPYLEEYDSKKSNKLILVKKSP